MENPNTSFLGRSPVFWGALVAVAVLLLLAIWWLYKPAYVALLNNANEAEHAEILTILSQWQVPYRINAKEGLIEVPAEQLANARMRMAESGVPARSSVGFEIFDQTDYGMSEFSQRINYQRALEGELARTVMTIAEVQSARVHLTFRKAALYQQQAEKPKASVVVRLHHGAALDSTRVNGIQQLVASAVEGMEQEQVVVLNESGHLLSSGDAMLALPEHLQITRQLEAELQSKAQQLLQGPLGEDGAKVSVRVKLNFDRVRSVKELPLAGEKNAVQHEKRQDSSESSSGELSSKRNQTSRETDYALGHERSEVEHATGKIERVSVGVVLAKPLSLEAVAEIRQLLEAALGLESTRGDGVVIVHIPRSAEPVTESAAVAPPERSETTRLAASAPPESWLAVSLPGLTPKVVGSVAAVLLGLLLLALWLLSRRRVEKVQRPRMSSVEREQLLKDLRGWIQGGNQG